MVRSRITGETLGVCCRLMPGDLENPAVMAEEKVGRLEKRVESLTAESRKLSPNGNGGSVVLSSHSRVTAEQVQIEMLRKASVQQRIALMRSLSGTVIELSRRAIRRQMPGASEEESLLRFVCIHYGRQLADGLASHLKRRRS